MNLANRRIDRRHSIAVNEGMRVERYEYLLFAHPNQRLFVVELRNIPVQSRSVPQ